LYVEIEERPILLGDGLREYLIPLSTDMWYSLADITLAFASEEIDKSTT
jgi:hypothetical protein